MAKSNFRGFIKSPTHIMKNSKTFIVVVFWNNKELISSTEFLSCPFSDHEFVIVALNPKTAKKGPVIFESRSINKTKLDQIDQALKDCPFDLLMDELISNIDERFYILKKLLQDILNAVSPKNSKSWSWNAWPILKTGQASFIGLKF